MPVAPKRAVGSSEPSAYERFHSTFQAAVTQYEEKLGEMVAVSEQTQAMLIEKTENLEILEQEFLRQ